MIGPVLIILGILMIFTGFFIVAMAMSGTKSQIQEYKYEDGIYHQDQASEDEKVPRPSVRGGGVIMLGPIPIIFGSDKRSAQTPIILAIILMLLALLLLR